MKKILLGVLFLLFIPEIVKGEEIIGDWVIKFDPHSNTSSMHISTNSTDTIMLICGSKDISGCEIFFISDRKCVKDQLFRALFNNTNTAIHTNLVCFGKLNEIQYYSMFSKTQTKNIIELMLQSDLLGIAIPILDAKYATYRFSSVGFNNSIQTILNSIKPVGSKAEPQNFNDL